MTVLLQDPADPNRQHRADPRELTVVRTYVCRGAESGDVEWAVVRDWLGFEGACPSSAVRP